MIFTSGVGRPMDHSIYQVLGGVEVDTFSAYRTAKKYYDKKEKPEADDEAEPNQQKNLRKDMLKRRTKSKKRANSCHFCRSQNWSH